MPRNGSGVYSLPAGNPVVPGTTISSSVQNSTMSDVGNELTNSLDRSGRGPMTAPLKLADGTVATPGLSFNSEPGSGFYRIGAGQMGLSIGGTLIATWSGNGLSLSAGTFGYTQNFAGAINNVFTNSNNGASSYVADQFTNGTDNLQIGMLGTGYASSGSLAAHAGFLITSSPAGLAIGATNAAGIISFASGGTSEKMRLDASGQLGVGTAPSYPFHIVAANDARAMLMASGSGTSAGGTLFFGRNGATGGSIGTQANSLNDSSPNVYINAASGNAINLALNLSTKLSITGQDLLGIGIAQVRQKTSATTRSSTTTPADDPDLIVPLAIGSYSFEADLWWSPGASAGPNGIKANVNFTGTQTSFARSVISTGSAISPASSGFPNPSGSATSVYTIPTVTTGGYQEHQRIFGVIVVSVTGNLSVQWSQNSSGIQNLSLAAASSLRCTKIA